MNNITKEDLIGLKDDLKEHINDKFKAHEEYDKLVHSNMHKILQNHSIALYGAEKRNGLVGDFNKLKGSSRVFKWIASVGGLSGAVSILVSYANS